MTFPGFDKEVLPQLEDAIGDFLVALDFYRDADANPESHEIPPGMFSYPIEYYGERLSYALKKLKQAVDAAYKEIEV